MRVGAAVDAFHFLAGRKVDLRQRIAALVRNEQGLPFEFGSGHDGRFPLPACHRSAGEESKSAQRGQKPYHPVGLPLFCSSSQSLSGAKYSTSALPLIWRSPVKASSASGQGLLAPISSMALRFLPTSSLP